MIGVASAVAALALGVPAAAGAMPVTVYTNGFESALNSGSNPGWSLGADQWAGTVLSGAAPGVVFPGSASPARIHGGSGALWSAGELAGAEDYASGLDSIDAYYTIKVRITAPSGTSPSALADIDAVESRYGGQWLRLESDVATATSTATVTTSGTWTTQASDRFSPYGAGGRTRVTTVPGSYVEFTIRGDADLGSPKADNPRRAVGILVGSRGPGKGRGGIDYVIEARHPDGVLAGTPGAGTIDEAASPYYSPIPWKNWYPVLMRGYARHAVDLSPYQSATYRFWYYMPVSSIYDPADSGSIRVVRQSDGTVLHQQGFSLQKTRWYEWSQVLGPGSGAGEQVWLEFRWNSNADRDSSEGLYFDDLVVSGELAPPTARVVTSSTHPVQTTWYKNATPAFSWNVTPAVAGYSWVVDGAASTTPDQYIDGDGSVGSWQSGGEPSGDRYFHIAAVDSYNQWSPTTHYRAKVDVQPPTTPSVNDNIASWNAATIRTFTWPSTDAHSGLARYWYGTSPGSLTATTAAGAVLGPFPQGTTTVYVVAEDNLGSRSATGTHAVNVDTSAPSTPTVTDEGQYTPFTTRTAASWTATDTYSGISSYEYAIGESPGATQIRDWTNVAMATSITAESLEMTYGVTYYVSVRARDQLNQISPVGAADGITPMLGAMSDPTVTDDGASTTQSASLHAEWTPVSGAIAYRVSVGSSPRSTDLAGWGSDLPTTTLGYTRPGLSIPDGTIAYFNVQAKNAFGDYGAAGTSDGILVDASPPTTPTVSFDPTVTASTSSVHFSQDAGDPHSDLSSVTYALGSAPGGTDIRGWTTVSPTSAVTATGLALSDGDLIYASARATNVLGAEGGTGSSGSLLIDSTPPQPFSLATPTAGSWIASQEPTFTWSAVTDAHSGVRRIELIIDGATNRTLGPGATQAMPQAPLSEGAHPWTVRAFDGAENVTTATGRTLNVDKTVPSTPTVSMTVASQFATDHLAASWSATDIPSGVASYEYAIGSAPGSPSDVRDWTDAGSATSVDAAGLALGAPGTYYFTVRAHDQAGNVGPGGTASSGTIVKAPSQVTLTGVSSSIAGRPVKLMVDAAREGASVKIWQKVGTSTSLVATLLTGSDGSTSQWVYPRSHTTYWATVVEDAMYGPATSPSKLVRVIFSVSAYASPVTARAGSYIYFTGKVVPSPARRYVVLQRKVGAYWRNVRIMRLSSSGWYVRNSAVRPRGYSYWRVRALADSLHLTGYSPTRRVRGF